MQVPSLHVAVSRARMEKKAKAEAHFAICRALAPHCALLHRPAPRPAKRITG